MWLVGGTECVFYSIFTVILLLRSPVPPLHFRLIWDATCPAQKPPGLPAAPSGLLSNAASKRTAKERQQAYRRFYKALTTHWLAVETTWRAVTRAHTKAREIGTAIDTIRATWMEDSVESLPDQLDVIPIVDFVWDFLGRSVSQSRTYFPEFDPREWQGEDAVHGMQSYSLNALLCARPPDVVELLLVAWDNGGWKFDHPRFLRRLGYFDAKVRMYPLQHELSNTIQTNTWLAMTLVERSSEERDELKWDASRVLRRWGRWGYKHIEGVGDARTEASFQIPILKPQSPIMETCDEGRGYGPAPIMQFWDIFGEL